MSPAPFSLSAAFGTSLQQNLLNSSSNQIKQLGDELRVVKKQETIVRERLEESIKKIEKEK